MTSRAESIEFFVNFLRSPRTVGSVVPSSNRLARRLALTVVNESDCVVELGAGTGPITFELDNSKVKVVCFEINGSLSIKLQKKFPDVLVKTADARCCTADISDIHKNNMICGVVSSLPLTVMGKSYVEKLIYEVSSSLSAGEKFGCFFYLPAIAMPWNRWLLRSLITNFSEVRYSVELANFPPALVVQCIK